MAPGIFVVWSGENLDRNDSLHDDAEAFDDHMLSLDSMSHGCRCAITEDQTMPEPYRHDIPFLDIYDLPDVDHYQKRDFRELETQALLRGNAFPPRIYKEVEKVEVEGCENIHPGVGDLVAIVTSEVPLQETEHWAFHRDVLVESLKQGPNFIRYRVLKRVDGGEEKEQTIPSSPYLCIYEWDSDEMPWTELVTAAQEEGWQNHIEGGLTFQVMYYHVRKYVEKGDVVEMSEDGAGRLAPVYSKI